MRAHHGIANLGVTRPLLRRNDRLGHSSPWCAGGRCAAGVHQRRIADGTVVIGDARSPGSMPTIRLCKRHGRPCLTIPPGAAPIRRRDSSGRGWTNTDHHAQRRGQSVTGRGNAVPCLKYPMATSTTSFRPRVTADVEQVPLQHGLALGGDGDDHRGILRALRLVHGWSHRPASARPADRSRRRPPAPRSRRSVHSPRRRSSAPTPGRR